jgi:hypothetical protein
MCQQHRQRRQHLRDHRVLGIKGEVMVEDSGQSGGYVHRSSKVGEPEHASAAPSAIKPMAASRTASSASRRPARD